MIWSKLKSRIKDLIAPELKDRIDIHVTSYRRASDGYGEAWITIDGEKIIGGGYYRWYATSVYNDKLTPFEIQHGFHEDFYNANVQSQAVADRLQTGIYSTSHIIGSLRNYLNTPLHESLASQHPIFRAFAIVDRRLGKRGFSEMVVSEDDHPFVQAFYNLRKATFSSHSSA